MICSRWRTIGIVVAMSFLEVTGSIVASAQESASVSSPASAEEQNKISEGDKEGIQEGENPGQTESKSLPPSSPAEEKNVARPEKAQPLIVNPPKRLGRSSTNSGGNLKRKKSPKKGATGRSKSQGKSKKERRGKRVPASGTKDERESPESKDENGRGQWAVVATDGAAAYKFPNFDSTVMDYLSAGKKIRISQKIFSGIGGFGAFYRVKVSAKGFGYIADVDVVPEFKATANSRGGREPEKNSAFFRSGDKAEESVPIFFTRYLGGVYGTVNFSEKLSGRRFSSKEWLAGFRFTGPNTMVDGLPLDISFLVHSGAPSFYSEGIAQNNPSGFFVISDIFFPYPVRDSGNLLVSWGLGLMATYTRFSLQIRNSIFDSQEIRVGLAAQLGMTYRWGRYAIRAEGKYYYEKTDYLGYFLTLMTRY